MRRNFLFSLPLIIIACFGCSPKSSSPQKSSQNSNSEHRKTISLSLDTEDAVIPDTNYSNQLGISVNRIELNSQDQFTNFPTVGVKLVCPNGFVDAKDFYGFEQTNTQSKVMIFVIPGPFSESTAGFTTDQLKTRGVTLVSKEEIEIDEISGILMYTRQIAFGKKYEKWTLAFGNENETKIITAMYPVDQKDKLSSQLKSTVLSTRNTTTTPTLEADVNFTITPSDKLELTQSMGKMLTYTKDGIIPVKSPGDPIFIIGSSQTNGFSPDKKQFAIQRLHQTADTKIKSIRVMNPISIDGLDGTELVADAIDTTSDSPIIVYQVDLFTNDSYYMIVGLVGTNLSTEYLPEFKRIARSLKRK